MRHRRQAGGILGAGVAAVLVTAVVGCGSTQDSSTSRSSPSVTAAASTTTDPQPLTAALVAACKTTLDVDKRFKTGAVISDEDFRAAAKGLTDAMRAAGRAAAADNIDRMVTPSPTGGLDGFKAAQKWCEARQ